MKKKEKKTRKIGNIGFFLAIPSVYILGCIFFLSSYFLFQAYIFQKEVWAMFACGLLGTISLVASSSMQKFRVFIHEIKHAVLVVLTGNKLTDFHFDSDTGHVTYVMYLDKIHLAPLITLAPYCFPLLSLPMLIICIIFNTKYTLLLSFLLGSTLGFDLATGYGEIHPDQTDLKRIFGGFLIAGAYIGGTIFMWIMCCLPWIIAGRNGYIYTAYFVYNLARKLYL